MATCRHGVALNKHCQLCDKYVSILEYPEHQHTSATAPMPLSSEQREFRERVVPTYLTSLPSDAAKRKAIPIHSGFIKYFPRAMAAVAVVSQIGNEKHNPGQPLHWSRDKSSDHLDCASRHLVDAGTFDTDGQRHSAMLAWRSMANLEIELENAEKAGQPNEDGIRSDP